MIQDWACALVQEPWCFHPAQVAELTDWQIVELYLKPASERADEFQRNHPTPGPAPAGGKSRPTRPAKGSSAPDYEPGTPGHRRQLVEMAFMGVMGMKRDAAEAEYDRQLAMYYEQGGV